MSRAASMSITLPAWMSRPKKSYITRSGGQYTPDDLALRFALSLRIHGTADALRQLARTLVPMVCLEHQPNMKLLSRTLDDSKVINAALNIINRVCELLHIAKGVDFRLNVPADPVPVCHMKPMQHLDTDGVITWQCRHCSHHKPSGWPHEVLTA